MIDLCFNLCIFYSRFSIWQDIWPSIWKPQFWNRLHEYLSMWVWSLLSLSFAQPLFACQGVYIRVIYGVNSGVFSSPLASESFQLLRILRLHTEGPRNMLIVPSSHLTNVVVWRMKGGKTAPNPKWIRELRLFRLFPSKRLRIFWHPTQGFPRTDCISILEAL